jgi:hypothetical protein
MKPYKAFFSMDCMDENIEGLTYGNTWNGWACPYFTYENALKLAELMPDFNMSYDSKTDTFIANTDDGFETSEEFPAKVIDGVKYYGIGNMSWCWYEFNLNDGE